MVSTMNAGHQCAQMPEVDKKVRLRRVRNKNIKEMYFIHKSAEEAEGFMPLLIQFIF